LSSHSYHISHDQAWRGVGWCLIHATKLFETAEKLHKEKAYAESIVLTEIAIEESFKGKVMSDEVFQGKGISKSKWENLQDHKWKLANPNNKALESVVKLSNAQLKDIQDELGSNVAKYLKVGEMKKRLIQEQKLLERFPTLKEKSLYVDWNESMQEWMGAMNFNDIELVSFYIIQRGKHYLNDFHFQIESYVNNMRKGGKSFGCTYPKYLGTRPIKQYQSLKENKQNQKILQKNKALMRKGYQSFMKFTR